MSLASTGITCPLPEVADALRPYIRSRQEVEAIRQSLHAAFPLTYLDAGQPSSTGLLGLSPPDGVRKAYWPALQAHQAAQSRYERLQAEFDQLRGGAGATSAAGANETPDAASLTASYLPLLRVREKHRKLVVLERAMTKIHATGGEMLNESFESAVKRELGDLPTPPTAASATDRETSAEADVRLSQLKQAILSAKHRINELEAARAALEEPDAGGADPHTDLLALQDAHSELTTWMEVQLAQISEVGASSAGGVGGGGGGGNATPAPPPPPVDDSAPHHPPGSDDIETLYEQYLGARQRLLEIVEDTTSSRNGDGSSSSASHDKSSSPVPDYASSNNNNNNNSSSSSNNNHHPVGPRPSTSEVLLPHLPRLLAARQQEQTLLLQLTHTRRLLAAAETNSQAVLARLADESHLLQQPDEQLPRGRSGSGHGQGNGGGGGGEARGGDWRQAAELAAQSTVGAATERVEAGQRDVEAAALTLRLIERIPPTLGTLVE